jgi:hypothetical protein
MVTRDPTNVEVILIENLILKYHKTEKRLLGRPSTTAPPTRINAHHYSSYVAANDGGSIKATNKALNDRMTSGLGKI